MAAIFQIRRGETNIGIADGELYLHKGSGSIQFGSGSTGNIIAYNLLPLNAPAYGDINLSGSITASGDVRIGGNIYLGNATADNISALGQFTTNLVPTPHNSIDVGTTSAYWRNVYATNISGAIAATNGVVSSSLQLTSVFEEKASATHTLVSGSSQVIGILQSLNSFSQSTNTRLGLVETSTGSLNEFTSSANIRLGLVETSTGSLNGFTSSANTRLGLVETSTGSLNQFTSSQLEQNTNLATITGSLIISASQSYLSASLMTASISSHKLRLDEIESYTSSLKTAIGLSGQDVTVNGNLTVNGTTTQVNSTQVNIGDNILELNFGGSQTIAGIYTKDATGVSTISGSLLWDSTNDYWKAGKKDLESKILLAGGDNVISSSLQLTELNSFTQSANTRLGLLEASTGSLNSFSSSTNIRLELLEASTGSLNSFSSSTNIRLGLLEISTGSLNSFTESANTRLGLLEASTGSLNSFSSSALNRLTNLEESTASLNTFSSSTLSRLTLIETSTGSLNSFSSSTLTRLGLIETSTGSLNEFTSSQLERNTNLATITGSLIISASQSYVSSSLITASVKDHEERISYLEGIGGISGGNPLTQLHIFSASAKISIANLESFTSSANTRLTNLEITSASINAWSSSLNATFATDAEVAAGYESQGRGIVSGSSQIVPLLPTGVISGSIQILGGSGIVSGAAQIVPLLPTGVISGSIQILGGSGVWSSSVQMPAGVVSGSSQVIGILTSLNSFTESLDATYATEAEVAAGYEAKGRGIWSGSAQLPSGVVSGSSQISGLSNAQLTNSSITIAGTSVSLGGSITAATILNGTNVISSSAQITSVLPSGVVSGSSQIDLTATTNYVSGILTRLNAVGVISGSSQISLGSATGNITLATQTTGDYVASLVQGTGVTITNNSGENSTPTIAIGQAIGTSANVQFNSIGVGTTASGTAGEIRATGDITAFYSSDIRLKENITPIPNALEKVKQISGNTYDWKEGYEEVHSHKGNDVGVIAQEIEEILPQIVTNRDTGFKAVQYEKIIPLLIEAIKELSAKIDRLENK
jgi:hypothetical protein